MKEKAEIKILPATEEDFDEFARFFLKYFYPEEPMNRSLKRCPEKDVPFLDTLQEGLSLKAVNLLENSEDNLMGVVLNKKLTYAKSLVPKTVECPKQLKIKTILKELDKRANIWEKVNNEDHFNIAALAVNSKYRGLKVGHKLVEESLNLAKSLCFKYASIECSSFYSANIVSPMGFELLDEIPYDQYLDENGEPIFKIGKPHVAIKKFIKKL